MSVGARTQIGIVEYGAPKDVFSELSRSAGISKEAASSLLMSGASRLATVMGFSAPPIQIHESGIRAVDIAGMLRLGPGIELEVVPKFLGTDVSAPRWREDFFFLAELSKHGRLLASDRLSAAGGAPRDLVSLVARSMVSMYKENQRRPLRTYRRAREESFSIEGDPDPLDIAFPEPEGFQQDVLRYDRQNQFNGLALAAFNELFPEVSDPQVLAQLQRVKSDLSPQTPHSQSLRRRVPSRSRNWQPLIDLCSDVVSGLGVSYKPGSVVAPGYVVDTWRVWEDFLTLATRIGFGNSFVQAQERTKLGSRKDIKSGWRIRSISVAPDISVTHPVTGESFLIDAKYKGHFEKGPLRISESDLYESMAFMAATGSNLTILVYPQIPTELPSNLGSIQKFEEIEVDGGKVLGVQVEVRGISKRNGLKNFAKEFCAQIAELSN